MKIYDCGNTPLKHLLMSRHLLVTHVDYGKTLETFSEEERLLHQSHPCASQWGDKLSQNIERNR